MQSAADRVLEAPKKGTVEIVDAKDLNQKIDYTHGAGEWDELHDERRLKDQLVKFLLGKMAMGAGLVGMPNAARHMQHYLDNTGTELKLDVDQMVKEIPKLNEHLYWKLKMLFRQQVEDHLRGLPSNRSGNVTMKIAQPKPSVIASQLQSDWYFAVGSFLCSDEATITITPDDEVTADVTLSVSDQYDWHKGLGVEIAGIEINDALIGKLHQKGLAREYLARGVSSPHKLTWQRGAKPGASNT